MKCEMWNMTNRDSAGSKEILDIKEVLGQMFFSKFCDIFQKMFLAEYLQMIASGQCYKNSRSRSYSVFIVISSVCSYQLSNFDFFILFSYKYNRCLRLNPKRNYFFMQVSEGNEIWYTFFRELIFLWVSLFEKCLSFFWSLFAHIWNEYGDLLSTDQMKFQLLTLYI